MCDTGATDREDGDGNRVVVGRATMDDVDAVADLWVELAAGQRAHGSQLRPESNRDAALDSAARSAVSGGLFVARLDAGATDDGAPPAAGGGVVGFVTFGLETGRYEREVDRGAVYNLYVRPEYRDDGVGARLMDRAEAALADDGAEAVALEAMADNAAARRFYERRGYEPHRVELEKPVGDDPKR